MLLTREKGVLSLSLMTVKDKKGTANRRYANMQVRRETWATAKRVAAAEGRTISGLVDQMLKHYVAATRR